METWHRILHQDPSLGWEDTKMTIPMRDLIDQIRTNIENVMPNGNPNRIVLCKGYEFVVISDHEFISNEQYMDYSCWTLTYRLMESLTRD